MNRGMASSALAEEGNQSPTVSPGFRDGQMMSTVAVS